MVTGLAVSYHIVFVSGGCGRCRCIAVEYYILLIGSINPICNHKLISGPVSTLCDNFQFHPRSFAIMPCLGRLQLIKL